MRVFEKSRWKMRHFLAIRRASKSKVSSSNTLRVYFELETVLIPFHRRLSLDEAGKNKWVDPANSICVRFKPSSCSPRKQKVSQYPQHRLNVSFQQLSETCRNRASLVNLSQATSRRWSQETSAVSITIELSLLLYVDWAFLYDLCATSSVTR